MSPASRAVNRLNRLYQSVLFRMREHQARKNHRTRVPNVAEFAGIEMLEQRLLLSGTEGTITPDWSTYLGGNGQERAYGVTTDVDGNVLVTGETNSAGWVSGGFDTDFNGGWDGFVAKFAPDGTHLWSTYLGGAGHDYADSVVTDSDGNVFVSGRTQYLSAGWVERGFDTTFNGGNADAFVIKLTPDGAHDWSTYLGGDDNENAWDITADANGDVIVTGGTGSAGWVSGGWDTAHNGGLDGYVAKITGDGQNLLWSSYLGGNGSDTGESVTTDSSGNVLVAGYSHSSGWVSGGYDVGHDGGRDAFIVKLSSDEGNHEWSTFLGGSAWDRALGVAVNASDEVFVTGETRSSGWVSNGYNPTYNGGEDAFAAKLSADGTQLPWSTYLGGGNDDIGTDIAIDDSGHVLISGLSQSPGWLSGTTHNGGWDAFAVKLPPDGTDLLGTFLGGSSTEYGDTIATAESGSFIVAGYTSSSGWISGGFDTSYNGGGDVFVAKLNDPAFNQNTPPYGSSAKFVTNEDDPLDVDLRLLVEDPETPDEDLVFAVGGASNGTVELLVDGYTARFTPASDFNGSAQFEYTVTDTGPGDPLTDTKTIDITVNPVNDAPDISAPTSGLVNEDALLSISGISVSDVDANDTVVVVTPIAAGETHNVGITVDGKVVVWGRSTAGQLDVPADLTEAVAVGAGDHHSLALTSSGTVTAWGYNNYGQTNVPSGLTDVVDVDGGGGWSIALLENGTIVGWGVNNLGQYNVGDLTDVTEIYAMGAHTVAQLSDGTVIVRGPNQYGEANVPAGLIAKTIGAGSHHNVALTTNNEVVAWGHSGDGRTAVPSGLTNVVGVAAGGSHSAALLADGTVVGWGSNVDGQIDVGGWSDIVAVYARSYHTLGLKSDGTLLATGRNQYGQIDVPTGVTFALPGEAVPVQYEIEVTLTAEHGKVAVDGVSPAYSITLTGSLEEVNAALATVTYLGDQDFNGTDTITITADDLGNRGTGGPLTDTQIINITVNPVNDAPVVTVPGAQTVNEDASLAINGVSVADVDFTQTGSMTTILYEDFDDGDWSGWFVPFDTPNLVPSPEGYALAGHWPENNILQHGLVLDSISELKVDVRWKSGQHHVDFYLIDGDDGYNYDRLYMFRNAGYGPEFVYTERINSSPVVESFAIPTGDVTHNWNNWNIHWKAGQWTLNVEGTGFSHNWADSNLSQLRNIALLARDNSLIEWVRVDASVAPEMSVDLSADHGTLTLANAANVTITSGANGTAAMTIRGPLSAVNAALSTLSYQGDQDFNGTDTITITADDLGNQGSGGPLTDTKTINITVNPVNDAPSFSLAGDPPAVDEDAGPQTVAAFATDIIPGPATDEALQSLKFDLVVTGTTGNLAFVSGPSIDATGALTYETAANANGTATVSVTLRDDGGTANGGVDTSPAQTFTITVNPVNDAPVVTVPGAQVAYEDTSHTINGVRVDDVDFSSTGSTSTLVFSDDFSDPWDASKWNFAGGYERISSNGNPSPSLLLRDHDYTRSVTTVNYVGNSVHLSGDIRAADSGDQDYVGVSFSKGNTWAVSDVLAQVWMTGPTHPSQPHHVACSLKYDDNGTEAWETLPLTDFGLRGNGWYRGEIYIRPDGIVDFYLDDLEDGADRLLVYTSSNPITPAYDGLAAVAIGARTAYFDNIVLSVGSGSAPEIAVELSADHGTVTLANTFNLDITSGANGSSAMTIQGELDAVNAALSTLSYQGNQDFNGTDTITITADDLGNQGSGGPLTDTKTIEITVNPVNDAPSFSLAGDPPVVNEDAGLQTVAAFATDIAAGPATATDEASQSLTFDVVVTGTTGNLAFTSAPSIDETGTLTYETAADANGTATVSVTLRDDGGTANGGVDTSAAQTFTITVNPVNDAPIAVDDSDTTDEDTAKDIDVLLNDWDPDTQTVSSGNVVYNPANGHYYELVPGVPSWDDAKTASEARRYDGLAGHLVTITSHDENEFIRMNLLEPRPTSNPTRFIYIGGFQPPGSPEPGGNWQWVTGEPFEYTNWDIYNPNNGGSGESRLQIYAHFSDTYHAKWNDIYETNDGIDGYIVEYEPGTGGGSTGLSIFDHDSTSQLGATITLNPDGTLKYDPTASQTLQALAVGETATDTFSYTIIDDQGATDTATVTVTVHGVNDVPVAVDDEAETCEDESVTIPVLDNDEDVDLNDTLSVHSVTDGANGTVTTNGTDVTYTPNPDFAGVDTFTYTVMDPHGATDTATATVTVNNLPDLSGRVYDDLNNNGIDDSEPGIEGVHVRLTGTDDQGAVDRVLETLADGSFVFDDLRPGTYTLTQETQPAGYLDGDEQAGALGGNVGDDVITDIVVAKNDPDVSGYTFAEISPSDMFGMVWRDFNNNGAVDFGESGIPGVIINLTGTDDRGNDVSESAVTATDGSYGFVDLRPGTYCISETQPADFQDGKEHLGDVTDKETWLPVGNRGYVDGNDRFCGIVLVPRSVADHYNFGERPPAGEEVGDNVTATIGFWHNKNGQDLIKSLNGGETATQLGTWLAGTFPSMYGPGAVYQGANGDEADLNLAGKTNAEIADVFSFLHRRNKKNAVTGGPPKVDAQVLAVALATYATSETLAGGTYAADYGFTTSTDGIAYTTFDVSSVLTSGEADSLGITLDTNGYAAIIDILLATNNKASEGLLYDEDGSGTIDAAELVLRVLANELYSAINE